MTTPERPTPGTIAGFDLTVPDVEIIRDFYAAVLGWRPERFDEGYAMVAENGDWVAGLAPATGANAGLPTLWMAYVVVPDLDAAVARCTELGGEVVAGPTGTAPGQRNCAIRDPAGAVLTLTQLAAQT